MHTDRILYGMILVQMTNLIIFNLSINESQSCGLQLDVDIKFVSPAIQMQRKPPILSRQVASFMHGLEIHSLISSSQRGPT